MNTHSTNSPNSLDTPNSWQMTFLPRYSRELSVGVVWLALLLTLAVVRPDFYSSTLRDTLIEAAPLLVAAIGMTLVILTRQIDISIGSQLGVCGVAAGLLAQQHVPMPLVALAVIALGALLGAFNGALVAWLRMPSIVVTLATLWIWRELLRWLRQGKFVNGLPANFQWFGLPEQPSIGGIKPGQWAIIGVALVIFALVACLLRWYRPVRAVLAVGSDQEAARLAGIRPPRVIFATFVALGAMVGLAALLTVVQLPQVDPKVGTGLEMQVIAAVVVGGTAISGGRGTLLGTLLGVGLFATIGTSLEFLHIPTHWNQAVQGGLILLAVASDALRRKPASD